MTKTVNADLVVLAKTVAADVYVLLILSIHVT